ncbi:MAG TPA: PilZ domain-containing protein [Burkholderiaceae bacterium]|nr:PilZ domain-containing protein [Burkholderiaceae bacterium]
MHTAALWKSSDERRYEPRKPLHTRVQLLLPNTSLIEARAFDISLGGLGMVSPLNLPVRAQGTAAFSLPVKDGAIQTIRLPVRIAYSICSSANVGFKIGLQWLSIDEQDRFKIAAYIQT